MVVKNIYLHSSSNSATAREIRTEDNDIYLNNTAHKTENVNRVQISRFFTFTLTGKETIRRVGKVVNPMGKPDLHFTKPQRRLQRRLLTKQCKTEFNIQVNSKNRDGSWYSKQNFNQYPIGGKRGITRILIAFPSAYDDYFFNTYYNR